MKKIFFSLSLLTVSHIYSFYKLSDGCFFKWNIKNSNGKREHLQIDKDNGFDWIYSYNIKLKYHLYCVPNFIKCNIKRDILFKFFKRNKFDREWWESLFDTEKDRYISIYYCDTPLITPACLKNLINSNIWEQKVSETLGLKYVNVPFRNEVIYTAINVFIFNTKDRINLSLCTDKNKKINLQSALLNYMKSQKRKNDQLPEYTTNFIRDIQHQRLNEKGELIVDSISKIMNTSKITYTQDQIDLLENSELISIWHPIYKKYSNKEYVQDWNKRHHKTPKKIEYKAINPILTGFAYDKRDNMTYNWIVDLGQDISILFDYADELKPNII